MFTDDLITRDSRQDIVTYEHIYTYEHPWLGSLEVAVAHVMFLEYPLDELFKMVDNIAKETFKWRLNAIITLATI